MEPEQTADYSLTVEEAGQILNISGARLRQHIRNRRIPAIMRAGAWFLKPADVQAFAPKPRGRPSKAKKD